MTIFMGIRTEKYVYASIDTKSTVTYNGKIVDHKEYEPKFYKSKRYNLSIATIGKVLETSVGQLRLGVEVISKIDSFKANSHQEIINMIVCEYKLAFTKLKNKSHTTVVIFGLELMTGSTYLYKVESPNFKLVKVEKNEALFIGSNNLQYKKEGLNILNKVSSRNSLSRIYFNLFKLKNINLLEWTKQTFDTVGYNTVVGYPLLAHIYTIKGVFNGGVILENSDSFKNEFNVHLNNIEK